MSPLTRALPNDFTWLPHLSQNPWNLGYLPIIHWTEAGPPPLVSAETTLTVQCVLTLTMSSFMR